MPRQEMVGVVVSDKCDKTVIVMVENQVMHPKYKKYIKKRKKYAAHDENNIFKVGDTVTIEESRPISRTKRWVALPRAEENKS